MLRFRLRNFNAIKKVKVFIKCTFLLFAGVISVKETTSRPNRKKITAVAKFNENSWDIYDY